MLVPFENVFGRYSFIMVLIQLCSSFGKLNGIELPLELLHGSVGKSMDFARRMAFPLASSDNGIELPPSVEDNTRNDFITAGMHDNADLIDDLPSAKNEMSPPWLQMQQQKQPETHQHTNYYQSNILAKNIKPGKHHHDRGISTATSSPLKRCSIEISSKIPGICQAMGPIGNACVSGDYIDVFNGECL